MLYRVGISISGYYETEVEADSKEDAIQAACEDSYEADFEYDTEYCEPVEEEKEETMVCVKGHTIKPMKSAAGWYMGTSDENGFPYCRITANYYKTAEEAEANYKNDYRYCEENNFCSRGRVCYDW